MASSPTIVTVLALGLLALLCAVGPAAAQNRREGGRSGSGGGDVPTPSGDGGGNVPTPSGDGGGDVPTPGGDVPTPGGDGGGDVPTPGGDGGGDVPTPGGDGGGDVPTPGGDGGGDVPSPGGDGGGDVPTPGGDGGGDVPTPGDTDLGDIVTDAFFNGIMSQAGGGCEGSNFYSRNAFLHAAKDYSGFAQGGSGDDGKREIAAFFAHATHETGHFCYISEINKNNVYCDPSFTQWPCTTGQKYYGRGPLQITWNYNYGPAGQSIGFDGLGSPDTVAQDPVIAFKAALWFWMNNVHGVMPQGFGATIRAINGALECNGNNPDEMNDRVSLYLQYCQQFGVDPGSNLTC